MARQTIAANGSSGRAVASGKAASSLILGTLAAGLVAAKLAGAALPLVEGEREALIALAVLGLAMCGSGPLGQIAARGAWLSWGGLAGSILGLLVLAVVGAGLGLVQLPLVASAPAAFNALAGLMVLKLGAGVIWRLTRRLM